MHTHAYLHRVGLSRARDTQGDEAARAPFPPHALDELVCCVVVSELLAGILTDHLVEAEHSRPLPRPSPAAQAGPSRMLMRWHLHIAWHLAAVGDQDDACHEVHEKHPMGILWRNRSCCCCCCCSSPCMPCSACTVLVYEPYFVMASQMSWAHPEAASLCYNLQGTGPGTGQRQSVDRIRAERCVYHAGLARTLSAAGTPHSPQHGTHVPREERSRRHAEGVFPHRRYPIAHVVLKTCLAGEAQPAKEGKSGSCHLHWNSAEPCRLHAAHLHCLGTLKNGVWRRAFSAVAFYCRGSPSHLRC